MSHLRSAGWRSAGLVAAVLAAGVVAGCGSDGEAPTPTPTPVPTRPAAAASEEAAYLTEVKEHELGTLSRFSTDDVGWLKLGYAACDDLDKGKTYDAMRAEAQAHQPTVTDTEMQQFLRSVTDHLCQDRRADVP